MSQRAKITILLLVCSICAAALFSRFGETGRDSENPIDLYSVVYSQLNAFHDEDFSRAYRHASLGFQHRFTVDQFADMMRTDYSGILNAQRVEFGIVETRGRHALIQVFFVDRMGEVTPCIYSLVCESEGWKIDGARILRRWESGERMTGLRA